MWLYVYVAYINLSYIIYTYIYIHYIHIHIRGLHGYTEMVACIYVYRYNVTFV